MTAARLYASAAFGILQRDTILFFSYRLRALTQVAGLCFTLSIFYFVSRLVRADVLGSPDRYFAFVVVGITIMTILTSAITVPQLLRQELVAGTFERLIASPMGAAGAVLSMLAFPMLLASGIALAGLAFATIVFSVDIVWSSAALALPVGLLGALAFGAIGLLFTSSVIVLKQASGMNWVIALLTFVSGAYFPVALLPWWIRWASDVQPFTPSLNLLRHLLVGTPIEGSPWVELAKLLGFAAVLVPGSLVLLSFALKAARRSGTILEY